LVVTACIAHAFCEHGRIEQNLFTDLQALCDHSKGVVKGTGLYLTFL